MQVFVANPNKSPEILHILQKNQPKVGTLTLALPLALALALALL